jgi:hypothetical protein
LTQQTRASIEGRISRANAGYADVMRESDRIIERMSPDFKIFAMFLANPASAMASSATSESVGGLYNVYHRIRYLLDHRAPRELRQQVPMQL